MILSPFRPQRKNVGGDDVSSSLYYIHLDTQGDDKLAPKGQRADDQPRPSLDSVRSDQHRIARKPLPISARVPQPQASVSTSENSVNATTHHNEPPQDQVTFPPSSQPVQNKENISWQDEPLPPNPFLREQSDELAPPPPAKVAALSPAPVVRKPLGPRQMSTVSSQSHHELPQPPPEVARPDTPPTLDEPPPPPLPARPVPPPLSLEPRKPATSFDELRSMHSPGLQSPVTPSRSPSPWSKHQKPFTPFSLTIIRRDPGTGHQWNIGKVTSYQSTIIYEDPYDPEAAPVTLYPRGYPAIDVHIETSGYARFRNFSTVLPKLNDTGSGNLAQNMKEMAAQMKPKTTSVGNDDSEGGFKRQVVMTYGKTWTHNLKDAFRNRNRSSTTSSKTTDDMEHHNEPSHPPTAQHRRQDSGGSTNSNESASYFPPAEPLNGNHSQAPHAADTTKMDEPHPLIITQPGPGLRPKGYTFTSPWNGRCDYRTSSNGRSLKCSHTRNTTSQGFNPLVFAQAVRDATSASGEAQGRGRTRGMSTNLASTVAGDLGNKVPVSELRFNLPATDLFNSKENRERAAKELRDGLGRLLVRSPDGHERERDEFEDDDGEEPIFDFSGLGREKAGGGNRGKRAKLGKLLIHDEGIKMLDLTVAANMGIWWQAWERSF